MHKIEIACFNLESALVAVKAGADRIELCDDYFSGGVTPREEIIIQALEKISIPLFIMIRPRGGNFVYSESEFRLMKSQIILCKEKKIDGIVFGVLDKKNYVDKAKCKELIDLAKPMSATFHRAFDETEDSFQSLEDVIECGFARILTSGKQPVAIDGAAVISEFIKKSGDRIIIMPGGGVRGENISELLKTKATEFHSSAINKTTSDIDEDEIRKMKRMLSK